MKGALIRRIRQLCLAVYSFVQRRDLATVKRSAASLLGKVRELVKSWPTRLTAWRAAALRGYGRWRRLRPALRVASTAAMILALVFSMVAASTVANTIVASNVNVLANGDFEDGFYHADGCGAVGNGWRCFTNGGAANYGYYDDQWDLVVASGEHSQLIELNTKGVSAPDADRYAGLQQTVRVVEHAQYTFNLRGLIRTTVLDGDPQRYRVQVGYTHGEQADWTQVSNWQDVNWNTYYSRTEPGAFSEYSTELTPTSGHVTIYVRIWKKWGVAEEEIDLNLDAVALVGPAVTGHAPVVISSYGTGGVSGQSEGDMNSSATSSATGVVSPSQSCSGNNFIRNGGFEQGFDFYPHLGSTPGGPVGGHVGKEWGGFENGGAANFGFYDDQWPPVVAEGQSSQLIEINTKGIYPPDENRYAGIYQYLTGLHPGATYELTVKGMLRGVGGGEDDFRFAAQYGLIGGHNPEWRDVSGWEMLDLGPIYPRTEPGAIGTATVRFTAPAHEATLFLRGWSKWAETEYEFDLNFDHVSVIGCTTSVVVPPTVRVIDAGQCLHVVQHGEYLSHIAARYGVTVHDFVAANGLANPNHIYVGQKLHIPGCTLAPQPTATSIVKVVGGSTPAPTPTPTATPEPVVQVISSGGVATTDASVVVVTAPTVVETPTADKPHEVYIVRPGDALGYIAQRYGVSTHELARVNGIDNPNFIYVGQELVIP